MIINKLDIKNLEGRFIIMLDPKDEGFDIRESENPEFWLEKRIKFISSVYNPSKNEDVKIILAGFYGTTQQFNEDEFVEHFNKPYNGERFHRLLTNKELDWLVKIMKERNY